MAKEIERKFLIKNDGWKSFELNGRRYEIIQGYLHSDEKQSIRIRLTSEIDVLGLSKAEICIKQKITNMERTEYEWQIPREDAVELLCNMENVVSKIRHKFIQNKRIWEVDVFEEDNDGLIVAEIEFKDEEDAKNFNDFPDWVGEEVTEDSRYTNVSLSKKPFNTWNIPSSCGLPRPLSELELPPSIDSLSLHKK